MKKLKVTSIVILLVLCCALMLTACNRNKNDNTNIPPNSNLVSTISERPAGATPDALDAKECLYVAAGELQRSGGFKSISEGYSKALGFSQGVRTVRTVVGNNAFKQSVSYSSVVKFGEQLYVWDDNYLSRSASKVASLNDVSWEDEAQKHTEEAWQNKIGYRNTGLTGYILNDATILEATLESVENGVYTFRYKLDTTIAPYYLLFEMRNNAGSKEFAKFHRAEIIVSMDSNFQVKTLTTDCEYRANSVGLTVNCTESITETFFDIGYNGDLPEKDFFEAYFDAEFSKPVEDKDPEALDVLMGMLAPYITDGENLNVSLLANYDQQTVENALLSIKLDIEDLSNISVDAKIGEELFVSYANDKLFVSYQDFKGSTTISGIKEFVNTLFSENSDESSEEFDTAQLLEGMTYTIANGKVNVNLPIKFEDKIVDINIFGTETDGTYTLVGATATLDDIAINIVPVAQWNVPKISNEKDYPEILGLTELVQNGMIAVSTQIHDIPANVMFDIPTATLFVNLGGINATLVNNTVFANVGEGKLKFDIDNTSEFLELIAPLFSDESLELPKINLEDILAAVGNITATSTETGVVLTCDLDSLDLKLNISLKAEENRWLLEKIDVAFADTTATIVPSELFTAPQIGDISQYVDVTDVAKKFVPDIVSLVEAEGYQADFNIEFTLDSHAYTLTGSALLDQHKNIHIDAVLFDGTTALLQADVVVANQVLFLDINGIKLAVSVANSDSIDIASIADKINIQNQLLNGLLDQVNKVIAAVKSLDLKSLDIANIIQKLSFDGNTLNLVADASFVELGTVDLELCADDGICAKLNNFEFASLLLNASANVSATESTVVVPNAKDYVLNLETSLFGFDLQLSADLLNMDIAATANVFNDVVNVRFVNNTVFAQIGNVKLQLTTKDISALLSKLGVTGTDSLENLDIASLLEKINIDLTAEQPCISLATDDFEVSVNFTRNNSDICFDNITVKFGEETITVEQSSTEVERISTDGFVSAGALVDQVLELVDTFKNADGISANVNTEVVVAGNTYNANIVLHYNSGLHIVATITEGKTTLALVDVYFVDNTLFADINGLKGAIKINTSENTKELNIEEVLGKVTGYSSVLDSVLDVVVGIMDNYKTLSLAEVITSITECDGVWTIDIDGTTLGLNEFTVAVDASNACLDIADLAIGEVTVNFLNATVDTDETVVSAPEGDYTTNLTIAVGDIATSELKLDLFNMQILGKVQIGNTTLDLLLNKEGIFAVCGNAKITLGLNQLDELMNEISKFVEMDFTAPDIDVKEALNSISKTDTEKGFELGISFGEIAITVAFENATVTTAKVNALGVEICASLAERVNVATVNTEETFVNAVDLIAEFADSIKQLIDANGYNITAKGTLIADGTTIGFDANVVLNLNDGNLDNIYAKALLSYRGVDAVNAEIWLVDNTLFAVVDRLKLAIKLNGDASATTTETTKTLEETLAPVYGYNTHLDTLLDLVKNIVFKVEAGNLNVNQLLAGLTFDNETFATLNANIDGAQFDISLFTIGLTKFADGTLSASIENFAHKNISLNVVATVAPNTTPVVAPSGDFTTEIAVKIDENNNLFGKLDLIGGIYTFMLENTFATDGEKENLFVMYDSNTNTFKIKKGTDIRVLGNIDAIMEHVKTINEIVKEFSGSTILPTADSDSNNIDIKALLNALNLSADENTVRAELTLFGLPMTATIVGGEQPQLKVFVDIDLMGLLKKNLTIMPYQGADIVYGDFDDFEGYTSIDEVLDDYMVAIDVLVHTNSWRFDFNQTSQITVLDDQNVATSFGIMQGSYLEFFYNISSPDNFTLRAGLTIGKHDGGNSWTDLVVLDVLFVDGRIYITYNNDLHLTVSIDAISECSNAFDDLKTAIPQISSLIDAMEKTLGEAEDNISNFDYTTIIEYINYNKENKEFDLVINGNIVLPQLGNVSIDVTCGTTTMTLEHLSLSFDNISVTLQSVTVSAAEQITESVEGVSKTPNDYIISTHTAEYFQQNGTMEKHMNFDSLEELIQAVADTARKTTFAIDGLVTAKLDIGMDWLASATIPLQLSIRVDRVQHEDGDEDVFISAMLQRFNTTARVMGSDQGIYKDDNGGQSYLYYDSTVKYTDVDENGNEVEKNGWFWVSRYPNDGTSDEAWTEMTVHDYCTDCEAVASENCYIEYCNVCGKEATDECKTVGYCSVCGRIADENCLVDYCTKCNAPATDKCRRSVFQGGHSYKIVSAHADKIHTAESVRAPHTVNTVMKEVAHSTGKPMLGNAAHEWNGSATQFTTETVSRQAGNNTYTISRLENELFEMLNLGSVKFIVTLNLEDIILGQIHKEGSDSATNTGLDYILANLQNIFKNYEYVVPEGDSSVNNPFFHVTANLKPLNDSFGTLDLNIGHSITYVEKQLTDEFGRLTGETELEIDELNLTYLRGTFDIASVVGLNFRLTLAQNWQDYIGDARHFTISAKENQPVLWNSNTHAPSN